MTRERYLKIQKEINISAVPDSVIVRDAHLMSENPDRPLFANWMQACEEYIIHLGMAVTPDVLYVMQGMYTYNTVLEYLEKYKQQ